MQLLLNKGAKIDSEDKDGRTPLLYATKEGHKAILQLLRDKGAEAAKETEEERKKAEKVLKGNLGKIMQEE